MKSELNKTVLTSILFLMSRERRIFSPGARLSLATLAFVAMTLGRPLLQGAVPKEVAVLQTDYQSDFARAKEPVDKVLRAEASKIVANLVKEGRAEEARRVGEQVEQKLGSLAIAETHPDLKELLAKYEAAMANATGPVREKYDRKVNDLIQKYAGKDMDAVLALGDLKKRIDGKETPAPAVSNPPAPVVSSPPEVLSKSSPTAGKLNLVGEIWQGPFGEFEFQRNGAGVKTGKGGKDFKFTWTVLDGNKIDYVEIGNNGARMNRRIWTFDELCQSADVADPTNTVPPYTVSKAKAAK